MNTNRLSGPVVDEPSEQPTSSFARCRRRACHRGTFYGLLALTALALLWTGARLDRRHHEAARGAVWQHSAVTGHWYAIVGPRLSWTQAQALAERWGGHLAVIESAGEQQWIVETILSGLPENVDVYLGAREVGRHGHWQWVNGAPFEFVAWAPGEPNKDPVPTEQQAYLEPTHGTLQVLGTATYGSGRGLWHDMTSWRFDSSRAGAAALFASTFAVYALLERTTSPHALTASPYGPVATGLLLLGALLLGFLLGLGCRWLGLDQWVVQPRRPFMPACGPVRRITPTGWLLLSALLLWGALAAPRHLRQDLAGEVNWQRCPTTGHWYGLLNDVSGWMHAHRRARDVGGHLVIIESAAEQAWIADTLVDQPGIGAYIGLHETGTEGDWRWVDGTRPVYDNWPPTEPSSDENSPRNVANMYGHEWRPERANEPDPHGQWNDVTEPFRPVASPDLWITQAVVERTTRPDAPTPWGQALALLLGTGAGLCLIAALLAALAPNHRHGVDPAWRWLGRVAPLAGLLAVAGAAWLTLHEPDPAAERAALLNDYDPTPPDIRVTATPAVLRPGDSACCLKATVTDADGLPEAITVLVDGRPVEATLTPTQAGTLDVAATWTAHDAADGQHIVTVRAVKGGEVTEGHAIVPVWRTSRLLRVGDQPTIWLVRDGVRRPFWHPDHLRDLGLTFDWVEQVSAEELARFELGPLLPYVVREVGTGHTDWIQLSDNGTDRGILVRWIAEPSLMGPMGWTEADLTYITPERRQQLDAHRWGDLSEVEARLEVVEPLALTPAEPVVGQPLTVSYQVRCLNTVPATVKALSIACRGPSEENLDFAGQLNMVLEPGRVYTVEGQLTPSEAGAYRCWPSYWLPNDNWHVPQEAYVVRFEVRAAGESVGSGG